ncbi:P-loop containing nucleoside triphosphate hydrolases superfamily protein, partial [Prunus dulcis]
MRECGFHVIFSQRAPQKRRIVNSTLCNERSSRSHCMIILDVPTVGARLMLVDMAGSENFEQAGQIGFEAKMQ